VEAPLLLIDDTFDDLTGDRPVAWTPEEQLSDGSGGRW
jgi:hypothetical protein